MNRLLFVSALLLGVATSSAFAAEPESTSSPSRYTLKQVRAEPAQRSERYTVKARFAPAESAGELRESDTFTLIGRFAKASTGCGPTGDLIFRHGFE